MNNLSCFQWIKCLYRKCKIWVQNNSRYCLKQTKTSTSRTTLTSVCLMNLVKFRNTGRCWLGCFLGVRTIKSKIYNRFGVPLRRLTRLIEVRNKPSPYFGVPSFSTSNNIRDLHFRILLRQETLPSVRTADTRDQQLVWVGCITPELVAGRSSNPIIERPTPEHQAGLKS